MRFTANHIFVKENPLEDFLYKGNDSGTLWINKFVHKEIIYPNKLTNISLIMNRNLIFVFILLAVLSMVNAIPLQKRETTFGKCPPIPKVPTQPDQISVSISPDPVVPGQDDTITVSGTLSKEITADY